MIIPEHVTLTRVRNPFDFHGSREVRVVDPAEVSSVGAVLFREFPLCPAPEVHVGLNGALLPADQWRDTQLRPGDSMSIVPMVQKGGGILMAIASVAAAVLSFGVFSFVSTAVAGMAAIYGGAGALTSTIIGTAAGALAAAATTMVAGAIINALVPVPSVDIPKGGFDGSATYNSAGNPVTEGGPVPVLYGTLRVTPPLIGYYLELAQIADYYDYGSTDDGFTRAKQVEYVNLLYAVAEGELQSIGGVEVNDTPIESYNEYTLTTALGTNAQDAIATSASLYRQKGVGIELDRDDTSQWITTETDGDVVAGGAINVMLYFPLGLYYAKLSGRNTSVRVEVQHRLKGGLAGAGIGASLWTSWGEQTVKSLHWNGDRYPIRRLLTKTVTQQGRYEVRVRFAEEPPDKHGDYVEYNQCTFELLQWQMSDTYFKYPNTALLHVRMLATGQLQGMPRVSCLGASVDDPAAASLLVPYLGTTQNSDGTDPGLYRWMRINAGKMHLGWPSGCSNYWCTHRVYRFSGYDWAGETPAATYSAYLTRSTGGGFDFYGNEFRRMRVTCKGADYNCVTIDYHGNGPDQAATRTVLDDRFRPFGYVPDGPIYDPISLHFYEEDKFVAAINGRNKVIVCQVPAEVDNDIQVLYAWDSPYSLPMDAKVVDGDLYVLHSGSQFTKCNISDGTEISNIDLGYSGDQTCQAFDVVSGNLVVLTKNTAINRRIVHWREGIA